MDKTIEEVIQEYTPLAKSLARKYTARYYNIDMEDAFSLALEAIWRAYPNFKGKSSLKTYLFRCISNRINQFIAKEMKEYTHVMYTDEIYREDTAQGDYGLVDAEVFFRRRQAMSDKCYASLIDPNSPCSDPAKSVYALNARNELAYYLMDKRYRSLRSYTDALNVRTELQKAGRWPVATAGA